MGEDHALRPVERQGVEPERHQSLAHDAVPPEDRNDADDGDDHRQDEGRAE